MLVRKLKYSVLLSFKFLNILSLDAPLVVLFWTEIICSQFDKIIPFYCKLVFFFSTWLAYSADRFLESYSKINDYVICDRHLFFLKNKEFYILIWLTILGISIYIAFKFFLIQNLVICFGLLVLVILNQLQSFFRLSRVEFIFPKNIRTSLILSLTCFYSFLLFSLDYSIEIFSSFLILGNLFYCNCLIIKFWEESDNYFKSILNKSINKHHIGVSSQVKISLFSLGAFCIIIFNQKLYLLLISIVLTVVISIMLERTKLAPRTKRVFLDQLFWIVPFLVILLLCL